MRRSILVTALLASVASAAAAQSPVEIGGGVAFAGLADGGDFWGEGVEHVGVGVHATVPLTRRFALEASTTLGARSLPTVWQGAAAVEGGDVHRTEGMYTIAVRQRFESGRTGLYGFVTYGLAGFFGTTSREAVRVTYSNGNAYSYPASTRSRTLGLQFPILGGGVEKELTPRLAFRADAQALFFFVIPTGFRTSASMVVPLGRYRTS